MRVDEIIQKVKQEAQEREPIPQQEIKFLNKTESLQKNHIYQISDFNKYYDEEFIDNAYNIILNREADFEGKNNYLSKLRDGTLSKTQIITSLYFSPEGKSQNITILGAKKRHIFTNLYLL